MNIFVIAAHRGLLRNQNKTLKNQNIFGYLVFSQSLLLLNQTNPISPLLAATSSRQTHCTRGRTGRLYWDVVQGKGATIMAVWRGSCAITPTAALALWADLP